MFLKDSWNHVFLSEESFEVSCGWEKVFISISHLNDKFELSFGIILLQTHWVYYLIDFLPPGLQLKSLILIWIYSFIGFNFSFQFQGEIWTKFTSSSLIHLLNMAPGLIYPMLKFLSMIFNTFPLLLYNSIQFFYKLC